MASYGYARVSTLDQDLTVQRRALRAAGCSVIRAEKKSGNRRDGRTELQVLLDFVQPGDTLVVTRIDRLARSLKDLQDIVHELKGRGVALRATEQPVDTSTAAGKAFLDMLGVFAEFETNLRRERQLEGIAQAKARGVYLRRAKKPVALFVDDAHDLHPKTLVALKRLTEVVVEGGGQLSVVLLGHPKLKNDLRRPQMEEIGDRTTVFEFGGLRDRQRDYIDWVLKISLDEGVTPEDIMTDAAATRLAAKLKTPLQIGQHLVRAFEAGFEVGAKPIDETVVEAVLSLRIDDLEPRLTRSGYDVRSLAEQFDAKPAEIRRLLRGDLDPARSRELMDEMRAAGLPT